MVHAAPASGGMGGGPIPIANAPAADPTDVFGPRVHAAAKWALPLVLGLVYGYWAAANRRDGGPITGWNLLFGFVTAVVFMALYVAVRAVAVRLEREGHAMLWAGLAGAALGFLVSQSGATWLSSTGLGLIVAVAFFLTLFYRFSTHGETEGTRRAEAAAA
jgi:hypothetical protein